MNILKGLRGTNIIYYDNFELDLDYSGITYLSGKNNNSKLIGRNNGSGKSLLASCLANVMIEAPPTHEKNKRTLKNALMTRKGAVIELDQITNALNHHRVVKSSKGNTPASKWTVFDKKEGSDEFVDMEFATSSKAEKFAYELTTLNEEEFYSTIYIDSRRGFVMYNGTASERYNYFSDLFRLDQYDIIKEHFSSEMKGLDETRVKYDQVLIDMAHVDWVEDVDPDKLQEQMKDLDSKVKSLNTESKNLNKILQLITLYTSNAKNLKKITDFDHKKAKDSIKFYKAQIKAVNKYTEYLKAKKVYDKKYSKLKTKVEGFESDAKKGLGITSVKALRKWIEKTKGNAKASKKLNASIKDSLSEIGIELDELETKQKKMLTLDSEIMLHKDMDTPDVLRSRMETNIEHIEAIKQFLDGSGKSHCSVCGGTFSRKEAKVKLKTLLKDVDNWDKQLEVSLTQAKQVKRLSKMGDMDEVKSRIEKLFKKIDKLKKEKRGIAGVDTNKLEAASTIVEQWADAISALDGLQAPYDKVEVAAGDVDGFETCIENIMKSISIHEMLKDSKKDILKGKDLADEHDTKKLEKKSKKAIDAANDTRLKSHDIQRDLERYEVDVKAFKKLSKKKESFAEELKDDRIFLALIDAFGKKGLKILAIQRICERIEENLNKYSHLVNPEKMKFKIEVGEGQFDIVVDRLSNGDKVSSDVRHLSGSEFRSFQLLWLVSILPFIPSERRYNVIILDELEANVDEVTRELIITQFLPMLQKIIPHIIFISPYELNYRPDCKYRWLEATKTNNKTELINKGEFDEH